MESGDGPYVTRPSSSNLWGSSTAGIAAPRNRSRVACQACNQRKVRCDVVQTGGNPCSKCQRDGGSCVILPRKKHRPRRKKGEQLPLSDIDRGDSGISYPKTAATSRLSEPPIDAIQEDDYGRAVPEIVLPEDTSFTYIGDRRGPRHSVYDLCHPESPEETLHIPPVISTTTSHKPHELEYMRLQGVFSKLPDEVCDELVRCYFQHVHFVLPIIDAPAFLNDYCNNGSRNISLLLYWSMLLAAANFVDTDVLRKAGFASRKAMKTAMYERAKCLYDVDRGTDKLVLIQSVILLGFWYTDPQDHTGAWYWIGIAISLSQNIGLHRSSRLRGRTKKPPSAARESLMRRIWWACVVRDRWVSLARGRPMRIHSEDCDTPFPVVEDVLNELESVTSPGSAKFIPTDSRPLAEMWIRLVKICDTLGNILRVHYRVNGIVPTMAEIDKYAQELQALAQDEVVSGDSSEELSIHAHQIDLYYQASIAILYRPYALSRSSSLPVGAHSHWRQTATSRAREAASHTNGLLQSLIELDAIRYLKPMIITAMIPAMQIHLYDCKSSNSLIRGLAENKLQLHMLVLSNLRGTYWSADVIYRLFERAQTILKKGSPQASKKDKNSDGHLSQVAIPESTGDRSFMHAQQQLHLQPSPAPQQLQPNGISMLMTPEAAMMMSDQQPANPWFSDSPHFSDVDQLLSPDFYLSEDVFPDFVLGYENSAVYGPLVVGSSKMSDEILR
ncbi:hypothetical protein LI328DRAFT_151755 [Trichoderma asperelloides]|nr:hypothetical protein LI328DRAFT_151755 [Trichoderma asperelloides]